MKILHVIPSVSLKEGGPSIALPAMIRALSRQGVSVDAATSGSTEANQPFNRPIDGDGGRYFLFRRQTEFYKVSVSLRHWIAKHISDYDLIHIHALFSYASTCAAGLARSKRIPYIIRPLGVLNQWGRLNRRPFLKELSLRWIEMPILRHAAAIHYTSSSEKDEAALANPEIGDLRSVVIPIPVTPQSNESQFEGAFPEQFPIARGRPIVLFLSRLDPKKGIELLLRAFAQVRKKKPDALLVLAGSGKRAYTESLRQLSEHLGIAEDVLWPGFVSGEGKSAALAAATIFVLPSFSENFGIAAAEALACGVPTIISDQVGLDDVGRLNAAMVVPCDPDQLAAAMERLLLEPQLRQELSNNGKRYVEERLSLETVGRALVDLYDSVLSNK